MKLQDAYRRGNITGSAVKDYFDSKFLLWCMYHAPLSERDPKSEYADLLGVRGKEFEAQLIQRVYPGLKPVKIETTEEILAELKKGAEVIDNLPLVYKDFVGIPDLLVREEGKSDLGSFHYVVKEIKSAKNIRKKHVMQAAFYTFILGKIQGLAPERFFLLNREGKEACYEFNKCREELLSALEDIREIIKGKNIEPAINTSYPWKNYAEKLAREKKDLTMIQGVSEVMKEKFYHAGIKTIKAVASMDIGDLMKLDRIGEPAAIKIKRSAEAWVTGKPIVFHKPSFRKAKVEIFFDFESTSPDENLGIKETIDYLFGMLICDPEEKFIPVVAKSLKDEEKALKEFLKILEGYDDFVMYVYSDYELKQFRRMFGQYKIPKKVQEKVLGNIVDLLKVVKASVVFPTLNNGLKEVAKFLGHKWRHDDVTGQESMAQYLRYLESGDEKILKKIIDYNEDDVLATKRVKDWLARQ